MAWDDELDGVHRTKFDSFIAQLDSFHSIKLSRYLFDRTLAISSIQLHAFSDASEKAYASVVYLRTVYASGAIDVQFLASKAKVSPLTKQTIPRLELLGACLMVKLVDNIRTTLEDELSYGKLDTYYWVDSVAALCWVRNDRPWKTYVQNRVKNILQISSREDWYYCPGSLNPADLPSRGKCGRLLSQNTFWWEGPQFLKLPTPEWPSQQDYTQIPPCATVEEKNVRPKVFHTMLGVENQEQEISTVEFGDKTRLLRVYAWVHRFIDNLKASVKDEPRRLEEQLGVQELEKFEISIIKSIQRVVFEKEITHITSQAKRDCPLLVNQLSLFLDEKGLLSLVSI